MQQTRRNAARLIAAKALRISVPADAADAASLRKQQRRSALLQLAAQLSPDTAQATAAAAGRTGGEVAITPEDRRAAAVEVYSLAQRREQGTPAHEREAVQLYDIALELHYESYWAYLKGLLLQELGDTEAACAALEAVEGDYQGSAASMAEQFRLQAQGLKDPFEEAAEQLYDAMAQKAGGEDALKQMFKDMLQPLSDAPDSVWDDNGDDTDDADNAAVNMDDRDLAAETAQRFVELLVDGDYASARALLGKPLEGLSTEQLREEYAGLVEAGRDGEEAVADEDIEICVLGVDEEELDDVGEVLGRAYVSVAGINFSEAVMPTVARENGNPRIVEIEWGRP